MTAPLVHCQYSLEKLLRYIGLYGSETFLIYDEMGKLFHV